MKKRAATLALVAIALPSSGMAAVDTTFCPEVLSRPVLEMNQDRQYLQSLFKEWDPRTGWHIDRELEETYVWIGPSASKQFKISVVEEQESPREERTVLQVDCPLPILWLATERPKVKVAFPARAAGASTVNPYDEEHPFGGWLFKKVTLAGDVLQIYPLWRLLEASPQSTIRLPAHVPAKYVGDDHVALKEEDPTPVRAFRMSEEPSFDQQSLWHLILPDQFNSTRTFFPVAQPTNAYFSLDLEEAVAASSFIQVLPYWDSALGRQIPCSSTANYLDPNHCARVNMRSYSGILENIRNEKPFYVQLFLKLGGSMLATYRVDKAGITPLSQTHVSAPAELRLPKELKW